MSAKLLFSGLTPTLLLRPGGYHEIIEKNSAGEYRSLSGSGTRLLQVGTDWFAKFSDGSSETYSASGELQGIVDRSGLTTTLYYSTDPIDSQRRLASVVGPFGHRLDLSYIDRRISSLSDAEGNAIEYTYDSNGNLTRVLFPGGSSREYLYEDTHFPHNLTGIIDENGSRLSTYAYDSLGRAITSERADGAGRVEISYDTSSSTVLDSAGLQTMYTFAATASTPRRVTGIDRGGLIEQFQLGTDTQRRITRKTDARGGVTTYSYNLDHLQSKTEAWGTPRARTTSYAYRSTLDDLPTLITGGTRRTSLSYDSNSGNVLSKTITDTATGQSRNWTYTYNSLGQLLTADGTRTDVSDVTTYTYYDCNTGYQCGQVQTITNALGHATTYNSYNAHGQPLTITDPNGVVTTLGYDLRQRLTSRTVGGETTEFSYYPTGLLRRVTLPDDSFIEYTYDAAHRLTEIEDAEGNRIVYTLDGMGNRTREDVYDPSGALARTRTWVFDTLNRLTQEIGAAGTSAVTTAFGYDGNDNQTSISASLGRNTTQTYDELNRLRSIADPANGLTQYEYDARDQLVSVTDPEGLTTSYEYNALGDLLEQVSPDTGTTTFTYDSAGNVATRTDARGPSIGQGVYTYDALNRVTQIEYPDHTLNYAYDACVNGIGRLCGMIDASGVTEFEYDSQGRLTLRRQTHIPGRDGGSLVRELRYTYTDGRLTRLRMPSGINVFYDYDVAGRVSAVRMSWSDTGAPQPILSNVLYDAFGGVRGWTWANGTLMVREYDLDGRLTIVDSAQQDVLVYDDADRITAINPPIGPTSWAYGYDSLDRLTSAIGPGLSRTYTYDANGNRLTEGGGSVSSAYNYSEPLSSNRIVSTRGTLTRNYTYDATGNVTGLFLAGDSHHTYDGAGRLSGSYDWWSYQYNGLGERVSERIYGQLEYSYMYDEGGRLIEKCQAWTGGTCNDWFSAQHIWLGDIPVATVMRTILYDAEGYITGLQQELFNVHTDHLNTPRRLTRSDSSNLTVWRWKSDPFGIGAAEGDPDGDGNQYYFDLRFPGQFLVPGSGLYYNYFRDYDPSTGRYVQSDPIGLQGGINTYAYAFGNPISNKDPSGLCPMCLVIPGVCAGGGCEALLGAGAILASPAGQQATQGLIDALSKPEAVSECPPEDECNRLNQEVQRTKAAVGALGACRPGMSPSQLTVRYQAWLALAVARAKRDMKCWNGGDEGHQQAHADAWGHVGLCGSLLGIWVGGPGLR